MQGNPGDETEARTETDLEPVSEKEPPRLISDSAWAIASSTWVHNHVRNSPMAESAAGWNHLGTILPRLREYLEIEMAKTRQPESH